MENFINISDEQRAEIEKSLRHKAYVKKLDSLDFGEGIFIPDGDANMQSLYIAMRNKGKKLSRMRQAIGYTFTRVE